MTSPQVKTYGNAIGGRWSESRSGALTDVLEPATGEVLARVQRSEAPDVDAAVMAAAAAQPAWAALPPVERAGHLLALADVIDAYADELALLESRNVGKPIRETAQLDIPGSARCLRYYASWADKLYGEVIPHNAGHLLNYTRREPLGVVGAITPWNGPLSIAMWKIAPALATGNTVVLKPADLTPLTALRLAELASEAGLPEGVFNVVTGRGSVVGQALVEHPGVAKIAFTGSTEVGQRIMRTGAATFKHLTLECGGKSPAVVFPDADLDLALEAALFGIFLNQGEVCAASSRLLVHSSIRDEFVGRLVERAGRLRVGPPIDPSTEVGSLVSAGHRRGVHDMVGAARAAGARVLIGGEPIDGHGNFYEPTVLDGVTPGMEIVQQEVFGPVLAVLSFADEDDGVRLANDSAYGLVANVFTRDLSRAHRVAERLQAGSIFVNMPAIPFTEAPFGGYKMTGLGKDLGRSALDAFTNTKSVVVNLGGTEMFSWFDGGK